MDSLEFCTYATIFANKGSFISFFPICMAFIYFSCLTTLVRHRSARLSKSNGRTHPCLVVSHYYCHIFCVFIYINTQYLVTFIALNSYILVQLKISLRLYFTFISIHF